MVGVRMEELLKTCPRAENSNFNNYTEDQKKVKDLKVQELKTQYPKMSEYYLDLLYDWLYNKTDSELKIMIDEHAELEIQGKNLVQKTPTISDNPITIEKAGYDPDEELRGTQSPVQKYNKEIAHLANLEIQDDTGCECCGA